MERMRTVVQVDGWVRYLLRNSIGQTLAVEVLPDGTEHRDCPGLHHFASHVIDKIKQLQWEDARRQIHLKPEGFASPEAKARWLAGENGQSDTGISGFQKPLKRSTRRWNN
jgi:hypothetical protein